MRFASRISLVRLPAQRGIPVHPPQPGVGVENDHRSKSQASRIGPTMSPRNFTLPRQGPALAPDRDHLGDGPATLGHDHRLAGLLHPVQQGQALGLETPGGDDPLCLHSHEYMTMSVSRQGPPGEPGAQPLPLRSTKTRSVLRERRKSRPATATASARPTTTTPIPASRETPNVAQRSMSCLLLLGHRPRAAVPWTAGHFTTFIVTSIFTTSPVTGSVEATVCSTLAIAQDRVEVDLESGRGGAERPRRSRPRAGESRRVLDGEDELVEALPAGRRAMQSMFVPTVLYWNEVSAFPVGLEDVDDVGMGVSTPIRMHAVRLSRPWTPRTRTGRLASFFSPWKRVITSWTRRVAAGPRRSARVSCLGELRPRRVLGLRPAVRRATSEGDGERQRACDGSWQSLLLYVPEGSAGSSGTISSGGMSMGRLREVGRGLPGGGESGGAMCSRCTRATKRSSASLSPGGTRTSGSRGLGHPEGLRSARVAGRIHRDGGPPSARRDVGSPLDRRAAEWPRRGRAGASRSAPGEALSTATRAPAPARRRVPARPRGPPATSAAAATAGQSQPKRHAGEGHASGADPFIADSATPAGCGRPGPGTARPRARPAISASARASARRSATSSARQACARGEVGLDGGRGRLARRHVR